MSTDAQTIDIYKQTWKTQGKQVNKPMQSEIGPARALDNLALRGQPSLINPSHVRL